MSVDFDLVDAPEWKKENVKNNCDLVIEFVEKF
jgi:hypothetical protein